MSVKLYKTVKLLVLLTTAGVAFVAIRNGADPGLVFSLLVAVLIGPEALETHFASNGSGDDET